MKNLMLIIVIVVMLLAGTASVSSASVSDYVQLRGGRYLTVEHQFSGDTILRYDEAITVDLFSKVGLTVVAGTDMPMLRLREVEVMTDIAVTVYDAFYNADITVGGRYFWLNESGRKAFYVTLSSVW